MGPLVALISIEPQANCARLLCKLCDVLIQHSVVASPPVLWDYIDRLNPPDLPISPDSHTVALSESFAAVTCPRQQPLTSLTIHR